MTVLITGGAGYIGSTVASAFLDAGDDVVVLDDLSRGSSANLVDRTAYLGDVADRALLDVVFDEHPDISCAVHCAALRVAPQSLRDPLHYYRENVAKSVALFEGLLDHGCTDIVFSSSAAVYGTPNGPTLSEDDLAAPLTPYGASKLMVERILADLCSAYGCSALSLRYFNPIGVDPRCRTGPVDDKAAPVLPAILRALVQRQPVIVNGGNWPTGDGTPLRDFVDVWDLATAHVAAARRMPAGRHHAVNVGSGRGTTVGELVALVAAELDEPAVIDIAARRPGEPDGAAAVIGRAAELFGWQPSRSPRQSVRAAIDHERRVRSSCGRGIGSAEG